MEILDLPHDLFLLVVAHLSARTTVRCRRVSRRWRAAFADPDLSLQLLKWHFPRSREVRMAYAAGGRLSSPPPTTTTTDEMAAAVSDGAGDDDGDGSGGGGRGAGHGTPGHGDGDGDDWTAVFTLVARRYHHLRTATPRAVDKIRLGTTPTTAAATAGPGDRFYGVAMWDRHLRLNDRVASFHYPDPSWCYGREEGVLVYHAHPDDDNYDHVDDDNDAEGARGEKGKGGASGRRRGSGRPAARAYVYPWRLLDLESGEAVEVPFPHDDDRIVRRVRLAEGVLVFEWCERAAYHQLNDREECHRHWATVLDVVRTSTSASSPPSSSSSSTPSADYTTTRDSSTSTTTTTTTTWTITPRTEFKFHFLGLPLNTHDRFFSAHTATRYAVYVWQPSRSPWGEADPIESALVWDISPSSSSSASASSPKPRVVRRLPMAALAFYGVRQRAAPRLRGLALDERNLYLVEEEHRWARGGHSSPSPPRVHLVRSTGIPVVPSAAAGVNGEGEGRGGGGGGQREGDDDDGVGDDDDDDDDDDADDDGGGEVVVQGPRWLDECGANGDVNLSFCSRTAAADMYDQGAAAATAAASLMSAYMRGDMLGPSRPGMIWDSGANTHNASNYRNNNRNNNSSNNISSNNNNNNDNNNNNNNSNNNTNPNVTAGGTSAALSSSSPFSSSSSPSPSLYVPRATLAQEVAGAAGAAGGRWPGWAPCWRHEEFPYLTVGEMVDFAAGVRVTARHCFMLETLSVHVRPSLAVRGPLLLGGARRRGSGGGGGGGGGGGRDGRERGRGVPFASASAAAAAAAAAAASSSTSSDSSSASPSASSLGSRAGDRSKAEGRSTGAGGAEGAAKKEGRRRAREGGDEEEEGGDEEVQFADEMWDEVVGKGFICGDERWLIGEDIRGRVTIVRF